MAMVGVDSGSLQADCHLTWSEGRRLLSAVLHSSNELGELLLWLCHGDSIINIERGLMVFIARAMTLRDP